MHAEERHSLRYKIPHTLRKLQTCSPYYRSRCIRNALCRPPGHAILDSRSAPEMQQVWLDQDLADGCFSRTARHPARPGVTRCPISGYPASHRRWGSPADIDHASPGVVPRRWVARWARPANSLYGQAQSAVGYQHGAVPQCGAGGACASIRNRAGRLGQQASVRAGAAGLGRPAGGVHFAARQPHPSFPEARQPSPDRHPSGP
jgi:hypothetical protein